MKQFNICPEIALCEMIYRSFASAGLFRGQRKRILGSDEEIGKIILPEISVKIIICGYYQDLL
jgi:hypothetical protein